MRVDVDAVKVRQHCPNVLVVLIRAFEENATARCTAIHLCWVHSDDVGAVCEPEGRGSHCALGGRRDSPACLTGVATVAVCNVRCRWYRWRRWWRRTQAAHLVVASGASGGAGLRRLGSVPPRRVQIEAMESLRRAVVEHAAEWGKVEGDICPHVHVERCIGEVGIGAVCEPHCLGGLCALGVGCDRKTCLAGVADAAVCDVRC